MAVLLRDGLFCLRQRRVRHDHTMLVDLQRVFALFKLSFAYEMLVSVYVCVFDDNVYL